MGIHRGRLAFERGFVQVPNEWARDERLSRRARGLLAELLSHEPGRHVTLAALQNAGPEGRDALRTAIDELRDAGYLGVVQGRGKGGRVTEIEYRLLDPRPVSENPTPVENATAVGFTDVGKPDTGTPYIEEKIYTLEGFPEGPSPFDEFWEVWPRKDARKSAERAWKSALRKTSASVILDAARAYADSPHRPAVEFVPYASTWLNGERWTDAAPSAPADDRRPVIEPGDEWMYR